jgi:CSLREA domain-containing protein
MARLAAALLPVLGTALLLWPGLASAATITVNTAADSPGAQCTLRDAIKAANTDLASNGCTTPGSGADTIQFQLPDPSIITLGSALDQISGDLNIQGSGASQLTVSGNSLYRIFNIASGSTVSISGLTVTGGSVAMTGCSGTSADKGGGILNLGTLTLDRVVVSGNNATASGGGQACVFGAGIGNAGTLTLNQSTVSGNRASATETGAGHDAVADGGGIDNGGTLRIDQSTVSGNTTHAYVTAGALAFAVGAGIYNHESATLTNTTVTNNGEITPGGKGGGILSAYGTLVLRNDTISQNVASSQIGDGGNLYIDGPATTVTAKNTIVAEALTSGNCGGPLPTSLGNNLGFESTGDTYPCFTPGNGNVLGDPMLGPPQDNGGPTQTEAIGPGSAALDAGADCEATDQRGLFRGGTAGPCDIGAFELGATASPPAPPSPSPPAPSPPASPADTTPPNTTITKAKINQARHRATFRFFSSEPGSTFFCKLDKNAFAPCRSPKTYKHLKRGKHKFQVEARDAAGNLDASPAIKKFKLKP